MTKTLILSFLVSATLRALLHLTKGRENLVMIINHGKPIGTLQWHPPQTNKALLRDYWPLVVSTHLKNISQIGSSPQVGVKMKNIWNHHLDHHHPLIRCYWGLPSWGGGVSLKIPHEFTLVSRNLMNHSVDGRNPQQPPGMYITL